ncbi:MAG: hypothetical protein IPG12_07775 [Saprospiraceae bacterium]|nr:hypothetical protein [Saprospiraceae bacterium]
MEISLILKNKKYYQNRIRRIIPYLDLQGSSVLDLGCGQMVLYESMGPKLREYLGMDNFPFSNKEYFILGDLKNSNLLPAKHFDFIFILGVIDHFIKDEKLNLVSLCKNKFQNSLIISQRNEHSLINKWLQQNKCTIKIEDSFENNKIEIIYLLKLPLFAFVFDLTKLKSLRSILSTEFVYIISKG